MLKPFLKWPGGKRKLLAEIKNLLPKTFNTYYEPFIGGGAVFFDLELENAVIINDINPELINCYLTIKNSVDELIEALKIHKMNDSLYKESYYYQIRNYDKDLNFYNSFSKVDKAARFIYLNRTCFNGLHRVNSKGQFNVPFGRYKNPKILNESLLREVSTFLNNKNFKILNHDFETVLENAQKGDLVYLDPPYDPISETSKFTQYGADGFNKNDQRRLKNLFDELTAKGCHALMSNSSTDFILSLYKDYEIKIVKAARTINSKTSLRGIKTDEVLIKNW